MGNKPCNTDLTLHNKTDISKTHISGKSNSIRLNTLQIQHCECHVPPGDVIFLEVL